MADPTESEETSDQPPKMKDWRKELEDRAKQAEERATRAERELAFNKAGLTDLTDIQVKALGATHEGPMTAESLRETAEKLGFTKAEQEAAAKAATGQPDLEAEAAELSKLTGSTIETGEQPATTQEAVDKAIRGFDRPDDLKDWLRQNHEVFDQR